MKRLSDIEKWKQLVRFDVTQAASDFAAQPAGDAADAAEILGVAYMVDVVCQLGTDVAADLLRNLPEDFRKKVITELPEEKSKPLLEILSYKSGTAGALMAKEYLSVPLDSKIEDVRKYLQALPPHKKGKVSYIYVVDQNRRLEGVIQVRDLVFHTDSRPIREILKSPVVQVETGMSQLDVAKLLQRHRYLGLPVVDAAQKLVGVVNADTALQIFEHEAEEDIAKIVGTSAEEIKAGSVFKIVSLRLPWLSVNIVSGLICALISGFFENDLATVAALFLFVPMVLGISESIGVQGATMVVRNLATGNISLGSLTRLFFREAAAGIFIGVVCGMVVGIAGSFWKANHLIGIALASSMTLSIGLSALIGLALPLIFKRFKIDPAIASGPLVLAICDIQALMVYFNLSSMILKTAQ